jgi:outer membrane lipoprotein-sorting protein
MRIATTFLLASLCLRADTIQEILERMNADAPKFSGVTADLSRTEISGPPINDSETTTGTLTLIKKNGAISALINFVTPDPKEYLFRGSLMQEYLPKANVINQYDLGKHSGLINQFLTLGFGASGRELEKNYDISDGGAETLKIAGKDVKTRKLVLVPKSPEATEIIKKIDFWVQDGTSYAVQLKIYEPSKNTNTAVYSNIQLNPPGLNEHAVELKPAKKPQIVKMN